MPTEWTDLATLAAVNGDTARSADWNALLDNLAYLYEAPIVTLRRTAAQGVMNVQTAAAWNAILWGEAVHDSHGDMWDSGSPGVVTFTRAGLYEVTGLIRWDDNSDGKRSVAMFKNDAADPLRIADQAATSPTNQPFTFKSNFAVNDFIDIRLRQTSGAQREVDPLATLVTVHWVRADPGTAV